MRHLYEIAVITSFTAASTSTSTVGGGQPDSTTSLQQDAPHHVTHPLHPNHYWTPTSCNFPTGQSDKLWSPASVSSLNPVTGQPGCVENAPSVSKFTSEESTCSWETDRWSRDSLVSRESIVDPIDPHNCVPCDPRVKDAVADFERFNDFSAAINPDSLWKDVTFISGPSNPDDLWRSNSDTVDAYSEDMSEDLFDQMLLRVAQGSSVLAVHQAKEMPWQAQTSLREVYGDMAVTNQPLREVYGDTAVTNQPLHNGFQSLDVDEANCQFCLHQQNPASGSECSACDTSKTVQLQMHHGGNSMADSGLVSRSSSLASLVATSSDTSDGNLADKESCESIARPRVKTLKGKTWNPSSSDKTSNSFNRSTTTSQINYQPQTAAFTSKIIQNVGKQPDSYETTSECSESVASYSLSSDSERTDLSSQMRNLDFTQWTRMKQNKFNDFPTTPFAFHSTEASSLYTAWRPEESFDQNSHIRVHSSFACIPPYVDQHPQNGFSLWDSGVGNMGTQLWDSSVGNMGTQLWDSSVGNMGTQLWDSSVGNMGELTQLWDAFSTTNALAYINESSHPMEAPQHYVNQTCNLDRTCYIDDTAKLPSQVEIPPYNCSLDHDSEFTPFQSLDVLKLPRGWQRWTNLQTILEISHRVVKLRVHKQLKMSQHEDNSCECKPAGASDDVSGEPVLQHYGTGFASHIDKETVVIRTHSELVGSSLEASKTDVVFVMAFPDGSASQEITCKGLPDNFSSSDYSKTSKFTCRTPADLMYYMHLFKDVPVVRENSLFNDSCYFTDSSPDISASGPDHLYGDQDATLQKDKENNVVHPDVDVAKSTSVSGGSLTTRGNTGCLYSHVLANRSEKSVKDTTETPSYNEVYPRTKNPAERLQHHSASKQPRPDPSVNMPADREHKTCDSCISAVYNKFFSPADDFVLPDDITIINSRTNISSGHEYQSIPAQHVDRLHSNIPDVPWHVDRLHSNIPGVPWHVDGLHSNIPGVPWHVDRLHSNIPDVPWHVDRLHSNIPGVPWENVWLTSPDLSSGCRLRLQHSAPESSPLEIMERRYDELNAASGTQFCPYADQEVFGRLGTYTSFSSFAGDVCSSYVAPRTFKTSSRTDEHADVNKWDYEKLLFLQNHHRDSYNTLLQPATTSHSERAGGFRSTAPEIANKNSKNLFTDEKSISITAQDIGNQRLLNTEKSKANTRHSSPVVVVKPAVDRDSFMANTWPAAGSHNAQLGSKSLGLLKESGDNHDSTCGPGRVDVFNEFASVQSYLDTWDRDLLNLDTDLSQIPDMHFIEAMVNNLLESSDDEEPRRDTNISAACCPPNDFRKRSWDNGFEVPHGRASVCLIISYPHGGPKMLSTGFFSRHGHLGGVLYDTPTCMGSCGAPVVVLTENTEAPFLTHFVHSGTVSVNGVSVGAGVAYFDKLPSLH